MTADVTRMLPIACFVSLRLSAALLPRIRIERGLARHRVSRGETPIAAARRTAGDRSTAAYTHALQQKETRVGAPMQEQQKFQ
jgi:hypothetical protein